MKLNILVAFGSAVAAFVLVRTIQGKQNVRLVKNSQAESRHKQPTQQSGQVAEKPAA
ncbi:hypothetical protein [Pseudoalteromonas phenolica]|uniref:hypothetical protein n=1 Tax=Pseudoalteromonas phenolica TaxID=161398 RepID=UPI0014875E62|nr:hypothetical protein [Pseudoalteromonas phenolica]